MMKTKAMMPGLSRSCGRWIEARLSSTPTRGGLVQRWQADRQVCVGRHRITRSICVRRPQRHRWSSGPDMRMCIRRSTVGSRRLRIVCKIRVTGCSTCQLCICRISVIGPLDRASLSWEMSTRLPQLIEVSMEHRLGGLPRRLHLQRRTLSRHIQFWKKPCQN